MSWAAREVLLDGELGDAVRIFRMRRRVLAASAPGRRHRPRSSEVKTKHLTSWFTAALIRFTLPITLLV